MAKPVLLGDMEQLVLLATVRLGADAYGARIHEELSREIRQAPSISTIYLVLLRLEERGLVVARMTDPTPVRGGRAKRVFEVTRAGATSLRASTATLLRMWRGAEHVLGPLPVPGNA